MSRVDYKIIKNAASLIGKAIIKWTIPTETKR